MMSEFIVSVIMPTYNRGYIIERAIRSVISQTYPHFELIIIDDGSIDCTDQVVSSFKDNRIKYIGYKENKGGNYARNLGLHVAKGEYIAFIDSDNIWDENHLKERMAIITEEENPVLSFGRMKIIDSEAKCTSKVFPDASKEKMSDREELIKLMMIKNRIDTNTVVISKNCFGIEEGFDVEFSRFQDWDFFYGILLDERNQCVFDDRVSVKHYTLNDSITSKLHLDWPNRLRMVKKYSDVIKKYQMQESVDEYLVADIQGNGKYSFIYQSVVNENDSYMTEYIIRIMLAAAEREKRTANTLKLMVRNFERIKESLLFVSYGVSGNIVIYGNGYFGKIVLDILQKNKIPVKYVVDRRNSNWIEDGIHYIETIDDTINVGLVIVAMASDTEKVVENIKRRSSAVIYTLYDLMDADRGNISGVYGS